ncbi:MAG: hypothetical protein HY655_07445 [Acidobacteria bacterium]|nr:hypothetical protein [Acidobacteriota bacterium]
MPELDQKPKANVQDELKALEAFVRADAACPFGPSFFLKDLGRYVRDRCPDARENLPLVEIWLANGETLDVCHIIGVTLQWVMLAVRDSANHQDGMAVELVPYAMIRHVRIGTRRPGGASIGFAQERPPAVLSAEMLLGVAAGRHAGSDAAGGEAGR